MASADRLTRLVAIRDNLEMELENETARRLALTAQGLAPPATYTFEGRSVDWTGYITGMQKVIEAIGRQINATGAAGVGDVQIVGDT